MIFASLEESLGYLVFGNRVSSWVFALFVFSLAFSLFWFLRHLGSKVLARLTKRTTTRLDDLLPIMLRKTHLLFLAILAGFAAISFLKIDVRAHVMYERVVMLSLILQAGVWANHAVAFMFDRLSERDDSSDGSRRTSLMALRMLSRAAVWALVGMLVFENLGFNMSAVITGLGIGGIAVALAVQNVLGDLLASLSIVLDKPFVVGDSIVVDDLAGTIEQIGVKTTRVRSVSGEQLVFSNADLLKARIRNFKRMQERRVLFSIGVTYDTPLDKLRRVPSWLEEIVRGQPHVRFDRAHFKEMGPYSQNFEVVYFLVESDYAVYMDIQQAINFDIVRKFADEKVEFAFPTHTVHVAR